MRGVWQGHPPSPAKSQEPVPAWPEFLLGPENRLVEPAVVLARDGALVAWEVGKNRLESIGEVEEAADFFEYYSDQMEQHDGYARPMGVPGKCP